ncbi:MAG: protease modulator HflC [Candidatus Cloacimonetes bacterium]|nr:protease modulator HflC [Candidatus Cloacimonadota bacterium]
MKFRTIVILVIVGLIILFDALYVMDEREQAIITQFGEPIGDAINKAGLHIKVPFIQKIHRFEKRILEWDGDPKQIPTSDKRYIWLDTFSRWQIVDPLKFYQTTRNETFAHSRLDDILSGTTRDIVSANELIEIVRSTDREMEYSEEYYASMDENIVEQPIDYGRRGICNQIYQISAPLVAEYGIKLIDVKVKRINYVEEVRLKVYDRMISERNKIAAKYRSEGQGKSAEILGKTKRELDQIESAAYRTAQEIRGRADAEAISVYADAYNRDPEFFEFLKTLEAYEQTMGEKNTVIMTTDSDFFKFLKQVE